MSNPEEQRLEDLAIIKIKLIENALLVRAGEGWLSFKNWTEASAYVNARIVHLQREREAEHS